MQAPQRASQRASSRAASLLSRDPSPNGAMSMKERTNQAKIAEVVKLKKPLAIMSLAKPNEDSTEYHVAGVVRQKFVFKSRPVPVLAKVAAVVNTSLCGTKRVRTDGPE